MMPFRFLASAKHDLDEIVEYYNTEAAGQGDRFAAQVEKLTQNIQRFPSSYVAVSRRVRCASPEDFPYNLFYAVLGEEILVLSIGHQRRHPDYWKERLKDIHG
jgi:plasmid stabilization system protein ParE